MQGAYIYIFSSAPKGSNLYMTEIFKGTRNMREDIHFWMIY